MKLSDNLPLFILEMANNHMGSVEHGKKIIADMKSVTNDFPQFKFSIKLQRRSDSFIHKNNRPVELNGDYAAANKYIKRFTETQLSIDDFKRLADAIKDAGFISMCTPWDEEAVDLMESVGFDILKVASCSFSDWPLWERIAKTSLPIIASTAAAETETIDHVVSFLRHRDKDFIIMHCVGEYPCQPENLHLGQIDFLKNRYQGVPIGFSTHESPIFNFGSISIAIAKGAVAFEKHVGSPLNGKMPNGYSSDKDHLLPWLESAVYAYQVCGATTERKPIGKKEQDDIIPLRRGVWARRDIPPGQKINPATDFYYAMPNQPHQFLSEDVSKYAEFTVKADSKGLWKDFMVGPDNVAVVNLRDKVSEIVDDLRAMLRQHEVALPPSAEIQIYHHLGIDNFKTTGAIIIDVVNRSYCKKLLVMFAGQQYPSHYHNVKEETFHLLHGDLKMEINGAYSILHEGEVSLINPGIPHAFSTNGGAIVEEISTTYFPGDSIYISDEINKNPNRKTCLTLWSD